MVLYAYKLKDKQLFFVANSIWTISDYPTTINDKNKVSLTKKWFNGNNLDKKKKGKLNTVKIQSMMHAEGQRGVAKDKAKKVGVPDVPGNYWPQEIMATTILYTQHPHWLTVLTEGAKPWHAFQLHGEIVFAPLLKREVSGGRTSEMHCIGCRVSEQVRCSVVSRSRDSYHPACCSLVSISLSVTISWPVLEYTLRFHPQRAFCIYISLLQKV